MSAAALAVNRPSPPRPSSQDRRILNSSPPRPVPRNFSDDPASVRQQYAPHNQSFARRPSNERRQSSATRERRSSPARPGSQSQEKPSPETVPVIKQERASSNEPSSPTVPSRHRPRQLDLSKDKSRPGASSAQPSAPLTGNAMHDVGIACLSPGFQTHDPAMRQQLQRSMDLREQQRRIIEQRQNQKDGNPASRVEPALPSSTFARPPGSSKRKGPPPSLNIQASSYSRFENEPRIVQSAPLNQSFTGLNRGGPHPLSRQVLDRTNTDRALPSSSGNRLPPIGDVFASQGADARRPSDSLSRTNSNHHNLPPPPRSPAVYPPQPSPGFAPSQRSPGFPPPRTSPGPPQPPASAGLAPPARTREFSSADEAVRSMSGGREDLMPKIVHYGGHQPPTPPSPLAPGQQAPHYRSDDQRRSSHGAYEAGPSRRRTRDEYERDYPEQRFGYDEERARRSREGPFGAGRESPETQRKKKEEFMWLCARAWDLFHS